MLQVHRQNLCEVNLPNRVTKIIEVPATGTVRTTVTNVLKRYNYSLDVMEIKNASTLQVWGGKGDGEESVRVRELESGRRERERERERVMYMFVCIHIFA